MRQGRNLVSNSDFNRKRGGSVLNLPSFTSENIVGGGQLRSNSRRLGCELASRPYSASSRSYGIGGEGNYASLMSSDFAGTETMLNPDRRVGGGRKTIFAPIQKGGKPLFRTLRSNIQGLLSTYGCESNDECPYTRNEISNEILNSFKKGGAGLTVCTPFHYEGGVC